MTVPSARRALAVLAVALTAGALGACTEKLESGAACPSLCPGQTVDAVDTVIDVALDTTLSGYPARGDESFMFVADRGSAFQTRAVIRFDTLTTKFDTSATDTAVAITEVHGSNLRLRVDSTGSKITVPFTVNVYDVSDAEGDAGDAAVLADFTASRRIGSTTFQPDSVAKDSLVVALSDSAVLSKIVAGQRLRVGLEVVGGGVTQVKLYSTVTSNPPVLRYDPTVTTDSVVALIVSPASATPAGVRTVASALRDYTIAVTPPRALTGEVFAIGGLPARRAYLRFDIPRRILDSTTVVRAALELTQAPISSVDPTTAVSVVTHAVLAGTEVTDLGRAANVLTADSTLGLTTLALTPGGDGTEVVEMGRLLQNWRTNPNRVAEVQHAIVLRAASEGFATGEIWFYSSEAADASRRPRLRVTYVPRVDFGVP